MDEFGVVRRATIIGSARATKEGTNFGIFYLSYRPDPRDVYTIEPLEGITRLESHWNEAMGVRAVKAYHEPLRVGETLTYMYRLALDTDKPTKATVYQAPTSDYKRCKVQVTFSKKRLPSEVWWFEHLTDSEIPGASAPARVLQPKATYTYVKEFENAKAGFCCGIGWRWQDEMSVPRQ